MRDVAQAAGVSPATVSNVLNARRKVDPDITRRVNDAVRTLGYRVNAVAANLRKAQASLVGLVIPDFQNPFFGELVARLEQRAEDSGYRLAVVSSREDDTIECAQMRMLIDWRVAGLIVVPTGDTFASRPIIDDMGLPAVVIDRAEDASGLDAVAAQNADATAAAYRYLHATGHRHILLAPSSPSIPNMRERVDGAFAAARALGSEADLEILYCGTTSAEANRHLIERFGTRPWPTAVLTMFNIATLATLKAASHHGVRIPHDVSLIGFDDYEWMQVASPPVTAVSQPVAEMADAAWDRLMLRLSGDDAPRQTVRIACAIHKRGSVAPPHAEAFDIDGSALEPIRETVRPAPAPSPAGSERGHLQGGRRR